MSGLVRHPRPRPRGLTLIELLIGVAVIGVILVLAAPSFNSMIVMQRLRGTTAQLVTDLQFARNEAVSRGTLMRLSFATTDSMSCYVLYTSATSNNRCDCLQGPGARCTGGNVEIKTVQIPASSLVRVEIPIATEFDTAFAFDNVSGGLYVIPTDDVATPFDGIQIQSFIDAPRKLAVKLNRSGRPQVCSPQYSTMTEPAC